MAFSAFLLLGLLATVPPADVTLRFASVDGCPEEDAFRALIEERLGFAPFAPDGVRQLEVVFEAHPEGHAARLKLSSDAGTLGERALFTTGTCAELAHSVALAASVAIDPGLLLRPMGARSPAPPNVGEVDDATLADSELTQPPAPSKAPPPAEGPPPPEDDNQSRSAPASAPRTTSFASLRVESGLGGFGSIGTEPAPTIGAELSLGLVWAPASIHVDAAFSLPGSSEVGQGASVSGTLIGARIAPCLRSGFLGACALGVGGVFLGAGHGLPLETTGVSPWVGAGGRLFLDWPLLDRLTFRVRGDLVVPIVRPVLVDSRTDEALWRASPLAATVGLQVLAALP